MAGQVVDALQGLTQYLSSENERMKAEDKEKRVQLAAEHIADSFQNLPPDASPQDIQNLQFELIEDAASIGGLQENLPLISGLHQSQMQTREITKLEEQDKALGSFIEEEFGISGQGLSGAQLSQVAQLLKSYEEKYTIRDEKGKSRIEKYNHQNEKIFELEVDALGFDEQFAFAKREMLFKHGLDKDLARFKHGLTSAGLGGNVAHPELLGKKFLKGQQGSKGELLYEDKGGRLWTINKKGETVRFAGGPGSIISRKGAGAPIKDILTTIQESREAFGKDRYAIANSLLISEKGQQLLEGITGQDIDDLVQRDRDDNITGLRSGAEQFVAQFFGQSQQDINEVLGRIYEESIEEGDDPFAEGDLELNILQNFRLNLEREQTTEANLLEQLPDSDHGNITDTQTWNTGVNVIESLFMNKDDEAALKEVQGMIGQRKGLPAGTEIGLSDFQSLPFKQQQAIVEYIDNFITIGR